jgi:hypothetical protein
LRLVIYYNNCGRDVGSWQGNVRTGYERAVDTNDETTTSIKGGAILGGGAAPRMNHSESDAATATVPAGHSIPTACQVVVPINKILENVTGNDTQNFVTLWWDGINYLTAETCTRNGIMVWFD